MRCPTCHRRLAPEGRCPVDGGRAPARVWPASEREIDRFTIERVLGYGGSAVVHAARDAAGRAVALKVARDAAPTTRARFAREADALARIEAPAAPALVGVGHTTDHRPWIAMELARGETLASRLERAPGAGALPPDEVRGLARRLAKALDRVHAAGIVHRDVKPENVVLGDDDVTLLDFGLCTGGGEGGTAIAGPGLTTEGTRLGTAAYMAPEQLGAAKADARADVYAMAAVLFEAATGRPPFVGEESAVMLAHASARAPRPSELRADAVCFDAALGAALAKDPERRPRSAAELARALDTESPRTAHVVSAEAPSPRRAIALMAASGDVDAIAQAAGRFGGDVQRVRDGRVVVAFARAPTAAHGVHAALATAAALRTSEGETAPAIHVAEARVRVGERAIAVGAAIERPREWPLAIDRDGVRLSLAAAALVGDAVTRPEAPALVGRAAEVEALARAVTSAQRAGHACLVTVLGARGMGKTRVLDEVARGVGVPVVHLDPRLPRGAGDAAALATRLRHAGGLVLLDDAHRADVAVLDAIERATMDRVPLAVVVAATEALRTRRPAWGERALASHRMELAPIDDAAARALFSLLLAPAEVIAEPLLAELVRSSGGVPGSIVAIAHALHRAGVVRRVPGGNGFYVAGDEVGVALRAAVDDEAATVLADMPPPVRRVAELLAVLDVAVTRDVIERCAGELTLDIAIDVGVALERLARAGLVRERASRVELASAALARAASASIAPEFRARAHAAALHAMPDEDAHAARHALGAGLASDARARFRVLAAEALARHRYAEAEEHASAALGIVAGDGKVLALRGRARLRLQRFDDALADIAAAQASARDAGERASLALDEATVRDWMHDFDGSAAAVDRAASEAPASASPRVASARGRTLWRRGLHEEARARFLEVLASPGVDDDTAITTGLMLGSACVYLGHLDEAEEAYEQVIARCGRVGDPFHVAVACSNRLALWAKRRRPERAEADLREALRIARELGNAQLERIASHNLAEVLYFRGALAEALPLARRSLMLQERFFAAYPIPQDPLLVARILAVEGGAEEEARALLATASARRRDGASDVLFTMVGGLTGEPVDWDALADEARRGVLEERAEVLFASVLAAVRAGERPLAVARAARATAEIDDERWRERVRSLVACCTGEGEPTD